MSTARGATPESDRPNFYARISDYSMTPLWEVMKDLVLPEPDSPCIPALWKYSDIRPLILEAGKVITTEEAERRVLILENPGMPGKSRITRSIYAGMQLIQPGEIANNHRHTQTALRFVLEGSGSYTAVGGERTMMHPGDFIITPQWAWHEHGNDGEVPTVWLDGLDIPIVQFFDSSFSQHKQNSKQYDTIKPTGDSIARYGSGLLPVDQPASGLSSPVFNYPFERTREALETMRRDEQWDPCHGLKMKYVNPLTGDYAMPTMAAFIQLLPAGFNGVRYQSTDSMVYVCVEGSGKTTLDDQELLWSEKDTFVIPSWMRHSHQANDDAILFSFSDRSIQQKCGLWKEFRENE
ncbi:MAG: gentisate 1,2-dioxygenase [Rhodospirillaceae bacterium]|nr:gentisate 1,2-dioxygenase [Rhodospirillaceae bacterium]|tara:strand:- start:1787 stop:2839 length:1053 start_codon:yes stop_codon:yes gene_type:complete